MPSAWLLPDRRIFDEKAATLLGVDPDEEPVVSMSTAGRGAA